MNSASNLKLKLIIISIIGSALFLITIFMFLDLGINAAPFLSAMLTIIMVYQIIKLEKDISLISVNSNIYSKTKSNKRISKSKNFK